MSIYGEQFDVKIYRNNALVFDDLNEVVSFQIEQTITSERSQATIRFDGATISPTSIQENDALEIWVASQGAELKKVFAGEIQEVTKVREEGEPFLDVIAYDWSLLLSERKVNLSYPIVVNSSTIVKGIVSSITKEGVPEPNERKISVTNVESVSKTRTIDFIGLTMFEALAKLSDYTLCDFYVDKNKDLNWFLRGSRNSNVILDQDDLQDYEYVINREVCNHVKVFGAPNRTNPEFDLDAYSDSLENWDSEAIGAGATIETTGTANTFTAEAYPGWTRVRGYSEYTQSMPVNHWTGDLLEWATLGTIPWLNIQSDNNLVMARSIHEGKKMKEWWFSDPNTLLQEVKEWKEIKLKIQTKFGPYNRTVWEESCQDLIGDFSYFGNVEVDSSGYMGNCFKIKPTDSYNGGRVWKIFSTATGIMEVHFWLKPAANTGFSVNDQIDLAYITDNDEYGSIKASVYMKFKDGAWWWGIEGWNKDLVHWSVDSSTLVDIDNWGEYSLWVKWSGSSAAIVEFKRGGITIATKTNINLTGVKVKGVVFSAYWPVSVEASDRNVRYDELSVLASALTRTVRAYLWVPSLYTWVSNDFIVEDHEYDWTWKEWDISSWMNDYNNLLNAKLYLEGGSQTGITNSDGYAIITYAEIYVKVDYYTGEGSPYISDDDGDSDYIEATSPDQLQDKSWKNFGVSLISFASVVNMKIYVKGRNTDGAANASIKVMVKDATTSAWIDLPDALTWTTGETSYTTKSVEASAFINTRYNIENLEIGFKKIGETGTIRITYAYVYVKYIQATSVMLLDSTVKKAGNYSIKLYWAGTIGSGTIETKIWRTFPSTIACQTSSCKEGLTELTFAALIDMSIWSNLDHWRRPEAKLDEFTVFLEDSDLNELKYSAGDLYPTSSFMATPGPSETKMKEIHVPVGSNAEADGKWELSSGSSFDWTKIVKVTFLIRGITDTQVEGDPYLDHIILWLDWLHFEGGKWYGEYRLDDNDYTVLKYGRSYNEIFDKTCFSKEDCEVRAKYYVDYHKLPLDSLENVEVDYVGMEELNPGELVEFQLPEGTLSLRITKITWVWEGDLFGKLELDNEGFQPLPSECPSEEQIENGGFETGSFPPWNTVGSVGIDEWNHHSGNYSAYGQYSAIIKQTFASPIKGSCFTNASVWFYGYYNSCFYEGTRLIIKIYYEDETFNSLVHDTTQEESGTWMIIDFLTEINPDKNVERVEFVLDDTFVFACNIDDVSMEC